MSIDDDENPAWTKADFARARGPECMSEAELAAFPSTNRIGRPRKETPKLHVNLRLDADVGEHFRRQGPDGRRGSTRPCERRWRSGGLNPSPHRS